MHEHPIRLRAAWQVRPADAADTPWSRIDLPCRAELLPMPVARLRRAFQNPRLDWRAESLWLVIDSVPGLISARLNGKERVVEDERAELAVGPEELGPSNWLELDVNAAHAAAVGNGFPWGVVYLLIRRPEGV